MRIVNKELLREFRLAPFCEWCKMPNAGFELDPHHLWAKGMGGGGRLDIRVNIIALCRACHCAVHQGHIIRADLLAIVAVREGVLQDDINGEIARLRRAQSS